VVFRVVGSLECVGIAHVFSKQIYIESTKSYNMAFKSLKPMNKHIAL